MPVAESRMPPTPPSDPTADPTDAFDALPGGGLRASSTVAAVTGEHELLGTLRDAMPDVTVVAVDAPHDLAVLLVERSCRALFLDLETVGRAAEALVPHLAKQFPDVPIVVVGTRADEPALAPFVTTGEIYRFLHRPVSLERARTFLAAALRRADDLERLRPPPPPPAPEPAITPDPPRVVQSAPLPPVPPPRRTSARGSDFSSRRTGSNTHAFVFAASTMAIALAGTAAWWTRPTHVAPTESSATAPVADPVGAASAAVREGALLAPEGKSAADLYREALARRPGDVEARESLLNAANALLGAGERALVDGRLDEALKAAETVAIVKPRDARVAALREHIARARSAAERASLDAAAAVVDSGTATKFVRIPRPPGPNTDERAAFEDLRTVETSPGSTGATEPALAGR
jgi:hypothetical protein